jgi:hypothetical protein
MWSKTFHLLFFLFEIIKGSKYSFIFFQMTSNVDVVYTRFVALDVMYNFKNHFLSDCLEPNISILSYTKIVVGLVLAEI